ncbi:MAG: AmmeMemoRadiSam system protein B [Candidatus Diapherotrites archaeon]|nr:AmmeMemoRadiSam system protein B [Candidatus Diapherotrites archaeon]
MRRFPAVAGLFYPSSPAELSEIVDSFLASVPDYPTRDYVAAIVPHAGYVYSGPIAAHAYKALATIRPEHIVIAGPNHTGYGAAVSVWPSGVWETPLGDVPIDESAVEHILSRSSFAVADTDAHHYEHSVEVQLPFLQRIYGDFSFVPVTMMYQAPDAARDLAASLPAGTLFIASSDFSHYVPADVGRKKDMEAIRYILGLDVDGFYNYVVHNDVSACGIGPIMVAMEHARRLGAKAELLAFGNSGDVTGDYDNVVDYAAVVFYK